MTSLLTYSGRQTIPAGAKFNAFTFKCGDFSSLMIRAESKSFQIFPDNCSSGVTLSEGEVFSMNKDDLKGVPDDSQIRINAMNEDTSDSGIISYWWVGRL